jgi:hypothetical protein
MLSPVDKALIEKTPPGGSSDSSCNGTIFTRSASIRIALPTLKASRKKFHVL